MLGGMILATGRPGRKSLNFVRLLSAELDCMCFNFRACVLLLYYLVCFCLWDMFLAYVFQINKCLGTLGRKETWCSIISGWLLFGTSCIIKNQLRVSSLVVGHGEQ